MDKTCQHRLHSRMKLARRNHDILLRILKFSRYAYSEFTLNLTRDMGRSTVLELALSSTCLCWPRHVTYGRCCRRSGSRALCRLVSYSSLIAVSKAAHPVPHCSTRVRFSCKRLLSHASSSCLECRSAHVSLRYNCGTCLP